MNDNSKLWDSVCQTDPKDTKKVTFGRPITAIDPYKQVRNATKAFGPAGTGWGWEVRKIEQLPTRELGILVRLWHSGDPLKYIEQWGQASLFIDNAEKKKDTDCFKKATTDGVTKCLSYLGFNADVFLGKFDDNKYVQEMGKKFEEPKPPKKPIDPKPNSYLNSWTAWLDHWHKESGVGAGKSIWTYITKNKPTKEETYKQVEQHYNNLFIGDHQ